MNEGLGFRSTAERCIGVLASLVSLVLCLLVMSCKETRFDYRGGDSTFAAFVASDDTLLIMETFPSDERVRFYSSDGRLVSEETLEGNRALDPVGFVLVDRFHIAVREVDSRRYRLAPADDASPLGQAFLAWVNDAGGVMGPRRALASTNAYADLGCAIGEDGSAAIWRTTDAASFQSAPAGTIASSHFTPSSLSCLAASGESYLVVCGVDRLRPIGERRVCQIFQGGLWRPSATLPLHEGVGFGTPLGPDVVAGVHASRDDASAALAFVAQRLTFRAGVWRVDTARLSGTWPTDTQVTARADSLLVVEPNFPNEVSRIPWPEGAGELARTAERVRIPNEDFYREALRFAPPVLSPTGARVLWVAPSAGEVRLARSSSDWRRQR